MEDDGAPLLPDASYGQGVDVTIPVGVVGMQSGTGGPKMGGPTTGGPTTPRAVVVTLYPQRWYILVLFAMLCFTQGGVWNTWGPLSDSGSRVFGWVEADIALLSNWGPIMFIISTPLFAWLMDVKGLRWASIVTGVLVAGGTGLRCITATNPAATWLIHTGHILNGFGGPVAMGAAPLLSALWFPAYQRTSATAFIAVLNQFGTTISFILGPLMVPYRGVVPPGNTNGSNIENSLKHAIEETKVDILNLMYLEFAVAGVILLLILTYFPNKPPQPPSITASIERVDFKEGVQQLFRHGAFWTLATPYAISGGVYGSWISVLNLNLKPLGISEVEAGWLGFYSSLAANIAGLVIGIFADVFKKRMKLCMMMLYWGAAAAFTTLTCVCQGYIPLSAGLLYPSLVLGAVCMSGVTPIFYELCCEATYPIAEGVTTSLLTWLVNVSGFLFLFLFLLIPNIGTSWMNWCLTASIFLCIPILGRVKEQYSRLDVESQHAPPRSLGKQD